MKIRNVECYGYIYKITNLVNRKVYIGQTTRIFNERYNCSGIGMERVFKYQKKLLNHKEWGFNEKLYNDLVEYGIKNFKLELYVDVAFSKQELELKEKIWIYLSNSFKNGYNRTLGGAGTQGVSNFGSKNPFYNKTHTLEVRKRISETHKGLGSKKVFCITTGEEFFSIQEASEYYNCDASGICKCCNNKREYNGKYKGEKLLWKYLKTPLEKGC